MSAIAGFGRLRYSFYFLTSFRLDQFRPIHNIGRSTGLNRDDAYELVVLLPPLAEQRRIVAKIEELFSELDKGVENLEKARKQLKVYRQAVLKHAFEGKLTAQWREENKDQLENPEQLLARYKAVAGSPLRAASGGMESSRHSMGGNWKIWGKSHQDPEKRANCLDWFPARSQVFQSYPMGMFIRICLTWVN